jgi:hypothetical protein
MLTILRRSLLIRGFINTEFVTEHYNSFRKGLGPLVGFRRIRYREEIVEGERQPRRLSFACYPAEISARP